MDRIAGAELGGVPLVTATSLEIGLPCLFVRSKKKDYGTSKQIEGVRSTRANRPVEIEPELGAVERVLDSARQRAT